MDLNDAVAMAAIATVVTGLWFGIAQMRQQERKRRDQAAFSFLETLQRAELFEAGRVISALPDGMTAADFEARGPELMRHIHLHQMWSEVVGYAVYRRLVPLQMVDEMAGGAIRVLWRKLRPWAEHIRRLEGSPNPFEWCQWLAERLEDEPAPGKKVGAQVAFADWRS